MNQGDGYYGNNRQKRGSDVGLVDAGREAGQRKTFGLGDILAEI